MTGSKSLGDTGFLHFFFWVVSGDYGKPWTTKKTHQDNLKHRREEVLLCFFSPQIWRILFGGIFFFPREKHGVSHEEGGKNNNK